MRKLLFGLLIALSFGALATNVAFKDYVTGLTGASALTGAELVPCIQSAVDRKCTPALESTFILSNPLTPRGVSATITPFSAGAYPIGFAAEGNVALSTGLGGTGNQSMTGFMARNENAGGYTTVWLANDLYTHGNITTAPNSGQCCNVQHNHQAGFIFQGSTVSASQVISAMPAGEALWFGTSGPFTTCLGTFNHCLFTMEGTNGLFNAQPSSGYLTGDAFTINGLPSSSGTSQYSLVVVAPNQTNSNGVKITAGGSSSDFALLVQNSATLTLASIDGVGTMKSFRPSGELAFRMNTGSAAAGCIPGTGFATDPINICNTNIATAGPINCIGFATAFTATSNAVNFDLNSLPAGATGSGAGTIVLEDNGTIALGSWQKSSTNIKFSKGLQPGLDNWTATGTKGLPYAQTICWNDA